MSEKHPQRDDFKGHWWCSTCNQSPDGGQVTYEEYHVTCGSEVYWIEPSTMTDNPDRGPVVEMCGRCQQDWVACWCEKYGCKPEPLIDRREWEKVVALSTLTASRDLETITALRAKNTELNRRLTKAEGQVKTTVEDCKRQGVSIGRGLAEVAYNELEVKYTALRGELKEVESYNKGLALELREKESELYILQATHDMLRTGMKGFISRYSKTMTTRSNQKRILWNAVEAELTALLRDSEKHG